MTNPKEDYNNHVRSNLPSGMTYANYRYTVNNKPFQSYKQADWYLKYITKYGWVAPSTGISANFQNVNSDGWSVDYTSPPTFDPVASPEYFTVTRQGYSEVGEPITFSENLVVTSRIRQPYANQASLTADQASLSDYIYSGDVVLGATNSSTRPYPKPIAQWMTVDRQIIRSGTFSPRLFVAHGHARKGKPVAAVKFTLSDGTTTLEQVVSAMTTVSYTASGYSVPCFTATFDVSSLIQGSTLTLDAVIYPWVGSAFTISTDADTYPSPNLTTQRHLLDRTGAYGTAYAYVSTTGNDATAVTSTNQATAAASPYLTLAAAAAAIKTFNNANFSRNSADGGIIRLVEGVTVLGAAISTTANTTSWPLTIEAADPTKVTTTILRDRGSTLASSLPAYVVFKNIRIQKSATGSWVFLDQGAASLVYTTQMVFDGCDFDANGATAYDGAVYKSGRVVFLNCTGNNLGQGGIVGVINKTVSAIGSSGQGFIRGVTCHFAIGCRETAASPQFEAPIATAAKSAVIGGVIAYCHFTSTVAAGRCINVVTPISDRGLAVVQSVIEQANSDTAPVFAVSADSVVNTVTNLVLQGNTTVGARANFLYQDTGVATVIKSGYQANNVWNEYNVKSDVFGANSNLIGNWPVIYNVSSRGFAALRGSSSGDTAGVGSWLGEFMPIDGVTGSNATPLTVNWVNDASFVGSKLGGGDYTPGSGNALPRISTDRNPYPVDMRGRTIASGGVVGAIQEAA